MAEKQEPRLEPPFSERPIPPPWALRSPSTVPHAPGPNGDSQPHPLLEDPTSMPLNAMESLPTISGKGSECFLVDRDIEKFLKWDLDLSRLNRIHDLLWMAGRPLRARPLHRYKMMGFDVVYTQQMDLHLLQFSNRLLLKALPEYMLDYDFWEKHICGSPELHASAAGFLLSYVWLICSPIDLKLAHDHCLLPSFMTWHWWKEFVDDLYSHIDVNSLDQVNKRYHFGDLRLGRINSIYRTRFMFTHFVRGYLYGYNRYVVFFQRNFSWILIVFVFFSLVLSAMQVGAGLPPLQDSVYFRRATYGFVVFSMISVAAILGLVGFIFVIIFLFNMVAAISHDKKERRERKKKSQQKKHP
ncbi:hypothetical protein GQ43DRAFT_447366 [Delitschia confertaspora ATCC 74209]|uniref:Uncharacterized protein n=1 Tax=Delitschia confertaspora ATCC 74209 TaxID=1513339 RepID=A0A9P4JVV7_9PLEO|nr:hypothetical protein GQ43DRAFT_447366 [Delitschia confertaspora ATCC 74209]